MRILDVEIDNLSNTEIHSKINNWINSDNGFHTIATVNAEMVVAAQSNAMLLEIINKSDLKTPESTAIMFASIKLGNKFKEKIPGIDLIWQLAKESDKKKWKWFLLGGQAGVAKLAGKKLIAKYPNLEVVGAEDGGVVALENIHTRTNLVRKINQTKPDILIVCFGIPKQELFMSIFKDQLNAKVGIGAGGSLDFIAGKQKRAPGFFQALGLEWLWRLIREPKRFKRIWTAVAIFPYLILTQTSKKK